MSECNAAARLEGIKSKVSIAPADLLDSVLEAHYVVKKLGDVFDDIGSAEIKFNFFRCPTERLERLAEDTGKEIVDGENGYRWLSFSFAEGINMTIFEERSGKL